jgi:hypothetical protein
MQDRLYKLGGVAFVVSGGLLLAKNILEIIAGLPPPGGPELVAWVASRQALFASAVEVFFFAVVFLIPATVALYESLSASHKSSAVIGCGIIAATIPVLFMLLILEGRLAYPVFHIELRGELAVELIVSLYYGGLHAVALLFVVPTGVLSWAMRRRPYGTGIVVLGIVAALFNVIGAYPWAIGLVLWLLSEVLFSAWLVLVGMSLRRTHSAAERRASLASAE